MVADGSAAMDPEAERQSKLEEYMSLLQRRRSDTEASRYAARVKKYASLQEKRRRAAASRKHVEHVQNDQAKKKVEGDQSKPTEGCDRQGEHGEHMSKRRGAACEHGRGGSLSRSRSREPVDRCGCRRMRRRRSRRRRRSCRRRRRRRRSCRRRRSRRRRRRSCRRRRRRRRRCCR